MRILLIDDMQRTRGTSARSCLNRRHAGLPLGTWFDAMGDPPSGRPLIQQVKETTVNKFNINAIAIAIGLAFSAGSMAQTMSKDEYKFGKDGIAADYKSAKAARKYLDMCAIVQTGSRGCGPIPAGARSTPLTNTCSTVARNGIPNPVPGLFSLALAHHAAAEIRVLRIACPAGGPSCMSLTTW